jgi:uncharacterized protein (DUF58 family)
VTASLRVLDERATEGEEVVAEVLLSSAAPVDGLQLALDLPAGVRLADRVSSFVLTLAPGRPRTLRVRLTCDRWGVYRLGELVLRTRDAAGLRVADLRTAPEATVRVYPHAERLRAAIVPFETQPYAGERVARRKGEGLEFADIRPFAPGDRSRRINWRASMLRNELYVNAQHPERNSDVVIFLDSFAEVRSQSEGTLDLAVRGAASLAEHYLATRDRVGLVGFGGYVRWLAPAQGTVQRYRILEMLLETEVTYSHAWKDIEVLPTQSLTPHALVIALTPLLDPRSVKALLDLRHRGFDLVVVELSPFPFIGRQRDAFAEVGVRFWRLWRDTLRYRYEQLGVPVPVWDGTRPLAPALEEVRAYRRFARSASA